MQPATILVTSVLILSMVPLAPASLAGKSPLRTVASHIDKDRAAGKARKGTNRGPLTLVLTSEQQQKYKLLVEQQRKSSTLLHDELANLERQLAEKPELATDSAFQAKLSDVQTQLHDQPKVLRLQLESILTPSQREQLKHAKLEREQLNSWRYLTAK